MVTDNQIAIALSTLCGQNYDFIYMDVTIIQNIFDEIEKYTISVFKTKGTIYENYFSNFSEKCHFMF